MRLLKDIKHKNSRSAAIHHYWAPCWNNDTKIAVIRPNNIFYFWAETGQDRSDTTIQAIRKVFFDIFGSKRPYDGELEPYENFFSRFDSALEATGLKFRASDADVNGNNPVRDALRPIECTDHCIDIFKQVLYNMRTNTVGSKKFLGA